MAATTEYDVSYFAFDKNDPTAFESAVQSRLAAQSQDGWRVTWLAPAGDGLLLVLERPVPPPPPPTTSLAGYGR